VGEKAKSKAETHFFREYGVTSFALPSALTHGNPCVFYRGAVVAAAFFGYFFLAAEKK
jgi:hypothetical protein